MSVNVRDRRGRIEMLQRLLRELGMRWGMACLVVPVSGCYDAQTEDAVRAFQETECIPVTGVCDRETWDAICDCCHQERDACAPVTISILPRECDWCLSPGEDDEAVYLLQYMLRALAADYDLGAVPIDGHYGEETAAAVKRFQRTAGIPASGRAERDTWRALAEAFNAAETST
ncbi:MAG: peptidoglycan-binding protein [Clostridiales bacterium]|nr:peptidoglycan-binding protein [Clostridiales bacterium]